MPKNDPLLQPFRLKHLTLKNRVVSTPHAPAFAEDGKPKERYQRYHEAKARGGLAMTMFGGSSCIGPDSPSVFGQLYVGDDDIIPWFQQFAERIHKYDCALMCQISHLGRRTVWNEANWLPVMAPSRVREPAHRGFPREMDKDDIKRAIGYYAEAARRCRDGGLDGCEILSHGHLPDQFLSPITNQRQDDYGGSFANRLRFTLEVLEAVREAVGEDFILGIRHAAEEESEQGMPFDEGLRAVKEIEAAGLIDYVSVNAGRIDTDYALSQHMPGMAAALGMRLKVVAAFRREIGLPLMHAGRIADLATARHAIRENIMDLVGMVRAQIADPNIVRKIEDGRENQIRPCVGAGYCLDRIYLSGEGSVCVHNAAIGREATMPHEISPSDGPAKRVVVVGGGPAGLEAARVSAERGHKVVLHEATGALGGQVLLASKASWRRDLIGIVDWFASELERLGVEIRWNSFVEAEEAVAEGAEVVIVATGGLPDSHYVPGGELCISVWDALSGTAALSGQVLVYDDNGQHQGPSCADHLSRQPGITVEMVTPDRHVAAEMGTLNYPIYLQTFYRNGVAMTPDHRLKSVARAGNKLKATFGNEFGGQDIERVVDHVVVEHGTLPLDEVFQGLAPEAANRGVTDYEALIAGRPQEGEPGRDGYLLFRVGDALASRDIHAAIYDSLRLCKDL